MGDAFEHVKSQIGACGIWCGSCAVGNGSLRELSRRFEEVFEGYGVGHWAPPELDDAAFTAGLATIRRIASCPGCRDGGGRADCEMKACAASRGHSECTECSDRATCPHGEIREEMRTGARDAGLFAETEDTDSLRSLAEWSLKLQVQWPSCILFLYDQDPGP